MKNQICKLLFGTLILTGTNQASILKHHSHPLYLAETFENDDAFDSDQMLIELEKSAVNQDFKNLISVLGTDLKTTWGSSGAEDTHDIWKYCTKIDQEIQQIQSQLGIVNIPGQPNVNDYAKGLVEIINQQFNGMGIFQTNNVKQLFDVLMGGFQIKEVRKHDILRELLDRAVYLNEKLQNIQSALGIEYVKEAGAQYSGYKSIVHAQETGPSVLPGANGAGIPTQPTEITGSKSVDSSEEIPPHTATGGDLKLIQFNSYGKF